MDIEMPRTKRMRQCSSNCGKSTKQYHLMDFPQEILLIILSKVPTRSLLSLRSVCKALYSLVNCPSLPDMHFRSQYTASSNQEPRVMVLTRYKRFNARLIALPTLKYDIDASGSTTCNGGDNEFSAECCGYVLKFVSCGLLCVKLRISPALIANPLTGEVLRLPPCREDELKPIKYEWYGMGFDAITSTHKILCVSGPGLNRLVTQVYVLGGTSASSSWRQIPSVPPCLSERYVSAYGNMHWLIGSSADYGKAYKNLILSFDFEKEEFGWTCHPNIQNYQDRKIHLVNWEGCLAIVDVSSISEANQFDIWVLKNYNKKQYWEKEHCIHIKMGPSCVQKLRLLLCFLGVRSDSVVGVWEHGIFFSERYSRFEYIVFFCDINRGNIRPVHVGTSSGKAMPLNIFSFTGSLISVRKYGKLIEAATGEKHFCSLGKMQMQSNTWPRYCREIGGLELGSRRHESFWDEK